MGVFYWIRMVYGEILVSMGCFPETVTSGAGAPRSSLKVSKFSVALRGLDVDYPVQCRLRRAFSLYVACG